MRSIVAGLVICLCAAACRDEVLGPLTVKTAAHPLAGIYDVATDLTTIDYEVYGPNFPPTHECLAGFDYCHIKRPVHGAELYGILFIGDTVIRVDTSVAYPVLGGRFWERQCAQYDYATFTGCLALGDSVQVDMVTYVTGLVLGPGNVYSPPFTVPLWNNVTSPEGRSQWLNFTITHFGANSLSGDVQWTASSGRRGTLFYGTFQARRR